ncbi:hypothetical protein E2562_018202 [Oryza meyeriana var. granulata]|uniref:Uncharacterized protein n=1 Tax=Oryza meyeriana var. granulata TaxID=110450 RepID=A0A6G1C7X6_9ORYZ|nr:hypothetical protein E2562_018202 [Oryza meyeriana var. granulata]
MVLRFLSRTPLRGLGPRDSPPADSPPPTSQGRSGNGARADVARKTKELELKPKLRDLLSNYRNYHKILYTANTQNNLNN